MRYAIYFAPPPGSLFHTLGSRWLGRDAFTGEQLEQPAEPGLSAVTGDPRRYGFHATMKPPFALRDPVRPEALLRAVAALASEHEQMPAKRVHFYDRCHLRRQTVKSFTHIDRRARQIHFRSRFEAVHHAKPRTIFSTLCSTGSRTSPSIRTFVPSRSSISINFGPIVLDSRRKEPMGQGFWG